MNTDIEVAKNYLLPPERSFWKWDDDGEVITLKSGATVVFREELAQILQRLGSQGLPPLASVLLVLASTRDRCYISVGDVLATIGWPRPTEKMNRLVESLFVDPDGIGKLRKLSPDLKNSIEAKVNLCQIIFENTTSVVDGEQTKCIVQYLRDGLHEVLADSRTSNSPINRIVLDDLRQLRSSMDAVDPQTLALRQETSLDTLPEAAEIELPLGQRARTLIDQIQSDDELQGLARLARQLMAAVTLPRRLADPEEIAMGGVSDISNRGPLDRLLLTELVHDDLTLAVRVSSNEALYLRRESPPRDAWREFSILLDSGIRMWGVPRVFATAVSLALLASADQHTSVNAFRAKGTLLDDVDLLSREGLLNHMQVLDPSIHPGDSLVAFAEAMGKGENASPILVTTEDVLEDESFQRELAKAAFPAIYLAVVQRDGTFRLIERNERGRKIICSVKLDLDRVLQPTKQKRAPLVEPERRKDLPAIFSVRPFPLFVSVNTQYSQLMDLGVQGFLGIGKDGHLHHWRSLSNFGAYVWPVDIPAGRLVWHDYDKPEQLVYAVVLEHKSRKRHLLKIDLDRETCDVVLLKIEQAHFTPMAVHGGVLLAQLHPDFVAIDTTTGDVRHQLSVPELYPPGLGRFCRFNKNTWHAVAFNGTTICLEQVSPARTDVNQPFIHVFEYDGGSGPLGITSDGSFHCTMTGETWEYFPRATWAAEPPRVTSFEHRVLLENSRGTAFVVDVRERTKQQCTGNHAYSALHPQVSRFVTPSNTRHRFTHISVERAGADFRLVLTTHKGTRHALEMRPTRVHRLRQMKLELAKSLTDSERQTLRTFKPVDAPNLGCKLSQAEWTDGSKAFLDQRGMLHLKPADPSVPEVTIVLKDGALAGWLSDGRLWGDSYFTGTSVEATVEQEAFDVAVLGFIRGII